MKAFYRKMMDRMVHPNLESKLALGRRSGSDRRKNESDRRVNLHDSNFQEEERRKAGNRRQLGVHEPRQRWFKINKSQSRHFSHDL